MSRVIRRERLGWDIAATALLLAVAGLSLTLPQNFPGSRWVLLSLIHI